METYFLVLASVKSNIEKVKYLETPLLHIISPLGKLQGAYAGREHLFSIP